MSSLKEQVLSLVKAKGPVLPVQINKEIGRDSFFSGAILSELVSAKVIKISNGKVGGSPVYYVAGQEPKLTMLYDHFPMREKEAFALLREKKVVKDDDLAPGIRVALRMIKDFAIPLTMNKDGKQSLVWKWYLLDDTEVASLLKLPTTKPPEIKPPEQTIKPPTLPTTVKEPPKQKRQPAPQIDFLQTIATYVKTNNIKILEETMVRKNREFDLIVSIPSNIGTMEYLINAKNKKTLNEADLTLAYQKGQSRKLPVILLTNGELTKKAHLYREKNLKGYVLLKKL